MHGSISAASAVVCLTDLGSLCHGWIIVPGDDLRADRLPVLDVARLDPAQGQDRGQAGEAVKVVDDTLLLDEHSQQTADLGQQHCQLMTGQSQEPCLKFGMSILVMHLVVLSVDIPSNRNWMEQPTIRICNSGGAWA